MDVVFEFRGRKAVPVRALPWMTRWWFGADDVAFALGHEEGYESFSKVFAYRFEGDEQVTLRSLDWDRVEIALEELASLTLPREEWEARATTALPAGAFVWLDDWERAYNQSPEGPGPVDEMAVTVECDRTFEHSRLNRELGRTNDELRATGAEPAAEADKPSQGAPTEVEQQIDDLKTSLERLSEPSSDEVELRSDADDRRLLLAPAVPEIVRDALLEGIQRRLQALEGSPSSGKDTIEAVPGFAEVGHDAGAAAVAALSTESNLATGPALTTDEVCAAFDGVAGRNAARWKDLLMKDRPEWATACRASEGRRGNGGMQSTWWPIKLAERIVTGPTKTASSALEDLDRAFAKRRELRPFRAMWKELRNERASIWGDLVAPKAGVWPVPPPRQSPRVS